MQNQWKTVPTLKFTTVFTITYNEFTFILQSQPPCGYRCDTAWLCIVRQDQRRARRKPHSYRPEMGCIPFIDVETNKTKLLPTSHPIFKRAWRKSYEDRIEKWKSICTKRGVIPQIISTSDDSAAVLTRFFSLRNRI